MVGLMLIGLLGWTIGRTLSTDAINVIVGVLFGILATIPAAITIMANQEQETKHHHHHHHHHHEVQPTTKNVTSHAAREDQYIIINKRKNKPDSVVILYEDNQGKLHSHPVTPKQLSETTYYKNQDEWFISE